MSQTHNILGAHVVLSEPGMLMNATAFNPYRGHTSAQTRAIHNDHFEKNRIWFEIPDSYEDKQKAKYCYVWQKDLNNMPEYSTTMPTGVYPGKMWKAMWGGEWYVCWYDISIKDPDTFCSVGHCPIILLDAIKIISPPSDDGDDTEMQRSP